MIYNTILYLYIYIYIYSIHNICSPPWNLLSGGVSIHIYIYMHNSWSHLPVGHSETGAVSDGHFNSGDSGRLMINQLIEEIEGQPILRQTQGMPTVWNLTKAWASHPVWCTGNSHINSSCKDIPLNVRRTHFLSHLKWTKWSSGYDPFDHQTQPFCPWLDVELPGGKKSKH